MKFLNYLLVVLVAVLITSCTHNTATEFQKIPEQIPTVQAKHRTIAELRAVLLNPTSDEVLVTAHRGDWRNAPENSVKAIQNCIAMGVDMVEIDVRRTKDGKLVLLHDSKLDRTTTGKGKLADWTLDSLQTLTLRNGAGHPTHHKIPTLEEALLAAKGKILVNLDKCYGYFDEVYAILEQTGTTAQIVMKGGVAYNEVKAEFGAYLDKVLFMPIVHLDKPEAWDIIKEYQNEMDPAAFEIVFASDTSKVLTRFNDIKKKGSRIWVNTLWESLNAGYEDDMALQNADSIYGWHLQKGATLFQTDRPEFMLQYLRNKKLHP